MIKLSLWDITMGSQPSLDKRFSLYCVHLVDNYSNKLNLDQSSSGRSSWRGWKGINNFSLAGKVTFEICPHCVKRPIECNARLTALLPLVCWDESSGDVWMKAYRPEQKCTHAWHSPVVWQSLQNKELQLSLNNFNKNTCKTNEKFRKFSISSHFCTTVLLCSCDKVYHKQKVC